MTTLRPRELDARAAVALFPALTPTLLPATHTNSYALGARDVLLVEPATPYEDEQREWVAWARAIGSAGRRVVAILATHHHPDHVGGAELLGRELGLPLWAHAATAERIDAPVARRLEDGEVIVLGDDAWRVLHTPGHAPGHVCLHEERSGVLVVGDMVASVGTILIAPGDGDMGLYLAQLERLAALDGTLALPAHGEPIPDPRALFERYVSHRRMREAKILAILREPASSPGLGAEELVPRAYDDASPAVWSIAKLSVEAHLEKLEREGLVARADRAGAFRAVERVVG